MAAQTAVATASTRPARGMRGSPCSPGGLGRLRYGQPGGQVSGDGGQVRVGLRRECLAHPQVEFLLGQHALHERGLEGADHLLAVGVGGPQAIRCPAAAGIWSGGSAITRLLRYTRRTVQKE